MSTYKITFQEDRKKNNVFTQYTILFGIDIWCCVCGKIYVLLKKYVEKNKWCSSWYLDTNLCEWFVILNLNFLKKDICIYMYIVYLIS